MVTDLVIGDNRFDPLTVSEAVTLVAELVGVITTDAVVAVAGVAPVIVQAYVGEVTFVSTADKVAVAGVNAPPEFCTKPV
jgi:hypothetical protein